LPIGVVDPHPDTTPSHRRRPLRILFVHRETDTIDLCLQELEKGQFIVKSDFVLNLADWAKQVRTQSYDATVIEYPSPNCTSPQVAGQFHQTAQKMPLIFLTYGEGVDALHELSEQGAFDYVEREHIAKLPLVVRRALNNKQLREELEEARKALRHSQSLYRALVDNPAYGIYHCGSAGELLDVNQALARMLGFASREQLMEANRKSEIFPNLRENLPFSGNSPGTREIEPVEIECERKDGTILKARLNGRGVYDDLGNFAGHEIIAVDITEQRTLEERLRHQASSDSLTGLANHRRLFEVLHAEICRSKRTGREFSLLLLDLDGLKRINDQFGHMVGSKALCRLAQTVADCCRSVDTAARHGGDEFAVVLPETSEASATVVGRRICHLLAKDSEEPKLSVSVGAASYPHGADTIGTLLYAADRALYAMKSEKWKQLGRAGSEGH
jgi:diguanylate cyclase (GGDEF)-like protein/PAS domain S-box-containing protein